MSWQTVQQWEREPDPDGDKRGSTAPKRTRMEEVARVLQTTVEYLQTGRDPSGGNLNPAEYRLISQYRDLPPESRRIVMDLADSLQKMAEARKTEEPH